MQPRSLVVLAALALVACGGDDDAAETTTVTALGETAVAGTGGTAATEGPEETTAPSGAESTSSTEDDRAAAEGALLVLADFPSGWSEQPVQDSGSDVEVQKRNAACIGSEGQTINDLGGANAETGRFTASGDDYISNAVAYGATAEVATAHMAALGADGVAECFAEVTGEAAQELDLPSGTEITDVTVAPLNVAPVGDEVVAYRVTIEIEQGDNSQSQYLDLVAVRVGRAVTSLQFGSVLVPSSDVDSYTALAAERLEHAPQ